jgi:hypothetical protein
MLDELKDLAGSRASAGMVLTPLRNDMSVVRQWCCCCYYFDLMEGLHEKDTVGSEAMASRGRTGICICMVYRPDMATGRLLTPPGSRRTAGMNWLRGPLRPVHEGNTWTGSWWVT